MPFDSYSSTHTVKAEQITEPRSVITPNGPMSAAPGQWEVRFPDGNVQVVDDDQFTAAFSKGEAEEAETEAEEEAEPKRDTESESEAKSAEVTAPPKPRTSSR